MRPDKFVPARRSSRAITGATDLVTPSHVSDWINKAYIEAMNMPLWDLEEWKKEGIKLPEIKITMSDTPTSPPATARGME